MEQIQVQDNASQTYCIPIDIPSLILIVMAVSIVNIVHRFFKILPSSWSIKPFGSQRYIRRPSEINHHTLESILSCLPHHGVQVPIVIPSTQASHASKYWSGAVFERESSLVIYLPIKCDLTSV